MSLTPYQKVGEFHRVFGHPLKTTLQSDIFDSNSKLVDFRISLIEEEIKEFAEALDDNDIVELIDALADILYVVFGACHVFGIDYDCEYSQSYSQIKYDETNKHNTSQQINEDTFLLSQKTSLFSSLDLLKMSCKTKDMKLVSTIMYVIVSTVCFTSSYLNIDMFKIFAEVHRSNMTKVCTNESDAEKTVHQYKENDPRYKSPSFRKSDCDKYWVIYDSTTSKILKSMYFELPNIKQFIQN